MIKFGPSGNSIAFSEAGYTKTEQTAPYLKNMGLDCFEPEGAFYAFPSIKSTGLSSNDFCEKLLYDMKVAVIPGTAFGECGEGHVRCSYAYSVDSITKALDRIETFVKKVKG